MQEFKDLSNTVINQAKFIQDETKNAAKDLLSNPYNVLDLKKKIKQQNPFNSLTWHWYEAQLRKNIMFFATLPFSISQVYWDTFKQVYTPEDND